MFALFAGLAAGLLHVFSGPDHLAAIAPLAVDGERGNWKAGLQWGIGHTTGVLLIAVLLLVLRDQLPLDAISANSERLVGVLLIGVGGWGAWRAMRPHAHAAKPHTAASFVMGTVHGFAGSSHLFGVLPALAMPSRESSALYLAGFGLGAIAGMTAFAAAMGLMSHRLGRRHSRSYSGLLYASSAAALVVGGVWLVGR
jgi:sulfite exporter TauE/SafE